MQRSQPEDNGEGLSDPLGQRKATAKGILWLTAEERED
jgi:hypothetical protein